VNDIQFVQKGDASQNFYDPKGDFVYGNGLISGFIFVNDHTEITIGAILGDDAALDRKLEILNVLDDVTALILELL
jgi:hypothetical protein